MACANSGYNNLMFLLNSSSSKDLELKSGGKYPRARWAEYMIRRREVPRTERATACGGVSFCDIMVLPCYY